MDSREQRIQALFALLNDFVEPDEYGDGTPTVYFDAEGCAEFFVPLITSDEAWAIIKKGRW